MLYVGGQRNASKGIAIKRRPYSIERHFNGKVSSFMISPSQHPDYKTM